LTFMSEELVQPETTAHTPDIKPLPEPEVVAEPLKDEPAAPKKRASRAKTKSLPPAAEVPQVPEAPPPTPEVPPTPAPKPKAKPRAKKSTAAAAVTIDAIDLTMPEEATAEPQRQSEEPIVTAQTHVDTRTPHQNLMDVQSEMRRLRREAKQVHYKKMLEGKI